MITYGELYDLIVSSGFDKESKDFYLGFLNRVRDATHLTAAERQIKYRILLNAIDAKNQAIHDNRWDVIIGGTISKSAEDIKSGLGVIGKVFQNPLTWLTVLAVIILILVKK